MREIVSTNDGKTLFYEFEDESFDYVEFETGRHMTGQDIADELNLTRARVSQLIKKGIKTIYYRLKNKYRDYSSIQIVAAMASVFNIKTDVEYKKFFRLFPKNIRRKINEEAREIGYF
jgi:predicted transcriptional regulator